MRDNRWIIQYYFDNFDVTNPLKRSGTILHLTTMVFAFEKDDLK